MVADGWLDALLRVFNEEPEAGLAGAKLVYPDGRLQEAGGIVFADGSGWNYGRFENPADPRFEFRRETDYCSGAAIMIERAIYSRVSAVSTRATRRPITRIPTSPLPCARPARRCFTSRAQRSCTSRGITAGTDTGSGMKRFQTINREKFLEKWKNELARQPVPIADAKESEAAANFRACGHVLIVDAYTPTPDQDSGSLRMLNLMHCCAKPATR